MEKEDQSGKLNTLAQGIMSLKYIEKMQPQMSK